jgi:transposase
LRSRVIGEGLSVETHSAEAVAFRHLYQANFKTSRAWALKESFAAFWDYRYPKSAQNYFDSWAARAMRSRLEPMKDVAKMLRRHRQGLLNYTTHRITNAAAEGFNSIIQTIKANARGFRSFENFRTRILFFCGRLDLWPVNAGSH